MIYVIRSFVLRCKRTFSNYLLSLLIVLVIQYKIIIFKTSLSPTFFSRSISKIFCNFAFRFYSRMGMQALPTGATTAWTQPGALQPGQQIASAVAAQQSAPAPAPPPAAAAMIPAYPTLHQFQVKQHPAPVQASAWPMYDHLHHHHHHLHHQHHGGYEANELSILKMATS